MTFQLETHPDAGSDEKELDFEIARIHELATEAIYYTTIIEDASLEDVATWLPDIRENLSKIVGKIENVAHCAGSAIHSGGNR